MPRVAVPGGCDESAGTVLHYRRRQAEAGFGFSSAVYQHTGLPFRIVEAARYRTAQLNGCITCQTWRAERDLAPVLSAKGGNPAESFIARGDPAPDEAFYAAVEDWRNASVFSERERLAIEFAERMGLQPRSFEEDEPFWERMHQAFSDGEIVDLTLSVASWIALGRTLHVLQLDPQVCAAPALVQR